MAARLGADGYPRCGARAPPRLGARSQQFQPSNAPAALRRGACVPARGHGRRQAGRAAGASRRMRGKCNGARRRGRASCHRLRARLTRGLPRMAPERRSSRARSAFSASNRAKTSSRTGSGQR